MTDPLVKIEYDEPGLPAQQSQPQQGVRFEDLWGTLRLVSSAPSWTPRGRIEDSLALYISGATYRLYVYDYQNGAWRFAALT